MINGKTITGLSGMSGAGKTTACEVFREAGFWIINCDSIAFSVTAKGTPCLMEIEEYFGTEILNSDGELNRQAVASLIFNNPNIKNAYENIVYPYIIYRVISAVIDSGKDVLLDAPTLFESGVNDLCDYVVGVVSAKEYAVERIMQRDGLTAANAQARLSAQKNAGFFFSNSDFLIENNRDMAAFKTDIKDVINKIRGIYGKKN